jgi:predicted RecB family nuclease
MSAIITSNLLEALNQCRRKAFLTCRPDPLGVEHEYVEIMRLRESDHRKAFRDSVSPLGSDPDDRRARLVVCPNGLIETGDLRADCDAVSQADLKARGRNSVCEPHLAVGTHSVTRDQRLRLAFAGFVIGESRQHRPPSGVLIPMSGVPKRVQLDALYPWIASAIVELRQTHMKGSCAPPPLILNEHCPTCQFRLHCVGEADRADNLTLLDRVTPKLLKKYNDKGIFTITQLSHVFRPRRRRKRKGRSYLSFNVELQALAIRTGKVYLDELPSIPESPVELFLDIEGIPDEDFHYLIGLVVKTPDQLLEHSFWADSPEQEHAIFEQLMEEISRYEAAPIFHYGSYDSKALRRASQKYGSLCMALHDRLVNISAQVFGKVYFPSRSNSLKDMGRCVGATWDSPIASGLDSLVWRHRWDQTHDDVIKSGLLSYNRSDCHAVRLLLIELRELGKTARTRRDVDFPDTPKLTCTDEEAATHYAFERILSSAHASYRNNRVRIRRPVDSSEIVKGRPGGSKGHVAHVRVVPKKAGRVVSVRRRMTCSRQTHKGQLLVPIGVLAEHIIIDLSFTKNGCRKTSTKYVGERARCPKCHHAYLPPAIARFEGRLFGHCFQAWAVYQRVVLHLSYSAISNVIESLFDEHISEASIVNFVGQLSAEYSYTERKLLRQIVSSRFIHVDETKISIHGTTYYVWVLTNGSHVVFRLTDTRETTLIQEMLDGYSGILVSDFYGGYDAVSCRQQKCLVHLILLSLFSEHYGGQVVIIRLR